MTDDSGGLRSAVQDVARDVYALQTLLMDPTASQGAKQHEMSSLLHRAPEWVLLTSTGVAAWRWERLARLGAPAKRGPLVFPPAALVTHLGTIKADPTLSEDVLRLVALMNGDKNDARIAPVIDQLVAEGRSPNAFMMLLNIMVWMADALIARSPMLRSREALLQQESLEMETAYLGRFS